MLELSIDPKAPLTDQVRRRGCTKTGSATGTCVYIFVGPDPRDVLYVGVAASLPERWQSHKTRAAWWPDVVGVRLSMPLASKAHAEAIERQLIRRFRPPGNRRSLVDAAGQPVKFTERSLHDAVSAAWNLGDLRTHNSLREQGTGNRERENGYQGHLQAQVSRLTTPSAFGDWTWR